jgi:Nucleotide-sugar transporter
VACRICGGFITERNLKQYSDNILKGFATSLSIVLSFLASVELFDLPITISFLVGASVVLGATWMYNMSDPQNASSRKREGKSEETNSHYEDVPLRVGGEGDSTSKKGGELRDEQTNGRPPLSINVRDRDPIEPALISPIEPHEPLLGYPNGIGTRGESASWSNRSIGERLLGKMSSMVGFATIDDGHETKDRFPLNSKGSSDTHASRQ